MQNRNNHNLIAWICAINQPNKQSFKQSSNQRWQLINQQAIKRWIQTNKQLSNQAINQPAQQPRKQSRFSHPKNESTAASGNASMFLLLLPLHPLFAYLMVGLPPSCFPPQVCTSWWASQRPRHRGGWCSAKGWQMRSWAPRPRSRWGMGLGSSQRNC